MSDASPTEIKKITSRACYSIADTLGMDLSVETGVNDLPRKISGSGKQRVVLFEGYSPTITPSIEHSLVDVGHGYNILAVQGWIWGNLGFVLIEEEERKPQQVLFLVDRALFSGDGLRGIRCWSRKKLFKDLQKPTKAIFYRKTSDSISWLRLKDGPRKLREYCKHRESKDVRSEEAYNLMWEDD